MAARFHRVFNQRWGRPKRAWTRSARPLLTWTSASVFWGNPSRRSAAWVRTLRACAVSTTN
ncbi:hypothetical protein Murka_0023 [Xanthomonas phage Murka]|nr:hypothetical protein Murka_0023 [Xanthomonas phage Murka]